MVYKLAVVGKNISYSKSPFIHHAFGSALNIAVDYTIQDVLDFTFPQKIAQLQEQGFFGCNITVPFKEEAFAMATKKSSRSEAAGAANTFRFNANGSIDADNTDGVGFIRDITQNIGAALNGKRVLICGAGGAVRGILGPLANERPEAIIIANRSVEKAAALAQQFGVSSSTYEALAHQTFDVVVDGTSLKTEPLPLPATLHLAQDALVYDLKYSPGVPTSIMQWAKNKGAKHIHDGMGMLVEQAAEAFFFWTGKRPKTQAVIQAIMAGALSGENPPLQAKLASRRAGGIRL